MAHSECRYKTPLPYVHRGSGTKTFSKAGQEYQGTCPRWLHATHRPHGPCHQSLLCQRSRVSCAGWNGYPGYRVCWCLNPGNPFQIVFLCLSLNWIYRPLAVLTSQIASLRSSRCSYSCRVLVQYTSTLNLFTFSSFSLLSGGVWTTSAKRRLHGFHHVRPTLSDEKTPFDCCLNAHEI